MRSPNLKQTTALELREVIPCTFLSDNNADVIASAAFSLGHRNDLTAIPYLVKLVDHPTLRVKLGLVSGLSCLDDKNAVGALIKLSHDLDYDVRNWATFELGSLCEINSKELRSALHERLLDSEYEIRGEALVGLALRKDQTIQGHIIRELKGEFNGIWAVKAAKILGQPYYCEVLIQLKDRLELDDEIYFLNDINEALSACC